MYRVAGYLMCEMKVESTSLEKQYIVQIAARDGCCKLRKLDFDCDVEVFLLNKMTHHRVLGNKVGLGAGDVPKVLMICPAHRYDSCCYPWYETDQLINLTQTSTWWFIPRIVSGLVDPGYKWDFCGGNVHL